VEDNAGNKSNEITTPVIVISAQDSI